MRRRVHSRTSRDPAWAKHDAAAQPRSSSVLVECGALVRRQLEVGLQINGSVPGYIRTEMTQALIDDPAFNSWVVGRSPAGRWGDLQDSIGPAVWLASDASAYVNGHVAFVDGGMSVVI